MYNYETEKKKLFTEEGLEMFTKIRDNVKRHLKSAGAVRMDEALRVASGSSWTMMACVDRMVETKEIREITTPNVPGQYRVFVSTSNA